ncbi:MAG: hypothetical protein Q7T52_08665, partial [Nocardioides sp.]|nr:hypothetical protein [Nocardioides sp.]
MVSRRLYALFGLLSTLVGMAVGHFSASLLHPDSSPVLAVGSGVIDRTPVSMKEWAIRNFESDGFSIGPFDFAARNYDKVVLIGSVFVGVAVLALVAGLVTRIRYVFGAAMLVVLVLVAAGAVVDRPLFEAVDLVPSILTAIAGVASLWWLHRTANGLPLDPRARSTVEIAKAEGAASAPTATPATPTVAGKRRATLGTSPVPADQTDDDGETVVVIAPGPGSTTTQPRPSRRGVLVAGGVLAA